MLFYVPFAVCRDAIWDGYAELSNTIRIYTKQMNTNHAIKFKCSTIYDFVHHRSIFWVTRDSKSNESYSHIWLYVICDSMSHLILYNVVLKIIC